MVMIAKSHSLISPAPHSFHVSCIVKNRTASTPIQKEAPIKQLDNSSHSFQSFIIPVLYYSPAELGDNFLKPNSTPTRAAQKLFP